MKPMRDRKMGEKVEYEIEEGNNQWSAGNMQFKEVRKTVLTSRE